MRLSCIAAAFVLIAVTAPSASAGAIQSPLGCRDFTLARNDDGSTGRVQLPFTLNFLGASFGSAFVNNNGNITFDAPLSTYTPFPLENTSRQIIAPFFADVDTRNAASDIVAYGSTLIDGHDVFCVQWAGVGVGYYNVRADKLNKFELLLIDRSDITPGDFDIVFNYDQVQWETGDASGGSGGLGGSSARVGFSNGTGAAGTSLELGGSAVNGAFLDSNLDTGLIYNSRNSAVPGRYLFSMRNGFEAPNEPPIAALLATPLSGRQPLPVTLDASVSYDPDGEIVDWSLDPGDGSPPLTGTGTPPAVDHTYTQAGTYTAVLRVVDDKGSSDSAVAEITVRRAETEVVAHPVVAELSSSATLFFPTLSARLSRLDPAEPLGGRTLEFYAGGERLCSAETAADGSANCSDVETSLRTLPSRGYQAQFEGDSQHLPSADSARLVATPAGDLP